MSDTEAVIKATEYDHKHEFRIRPYDPDWCIVTKDNEGHDITVADSLPEWLAEWMCVALNAGIKHDLAVLPELVENLESVIQGMHLALTIDADKFESSFPQNYRLIESNKRALLSTLDRLKKKGDQ